MKNLIISSDNKHKIEEIKNVLRDMNINIISKSESGIRELEVDETEDTLAGNALLKARAIYELKKGNFIIADDTGLFVNSLKGEPGVHSARYAGDDHDDEKNRLKLIYNLKDKEDRSAYFKTVIALIDQSGKEYILEGICKGTIVKEPRGTEGFGYDSLFLPNGKTETFAEMSFDEKNKISHRRLALDSLKEKLKDLIK